MEHYLTSGRCAQKQQSHQLTTAQLQNMSLWFCIVVCSLRSQLLCVILGGRFVNLERTVGRGTAWLDGISGGSNSEGPPSQVTWEVAGAFEIFHHQLDFSVSDKHLVPVDFMDVALKPVKKSNGRFACFMQNFAKLFSQHTAVTLVFPSSRKNHLKRFCFTIGTHSPLSFDDLSFNDLNDLLLATKTGKNGYHNAIICHQASPVCQQFHSHTIVLMLLSLPLHGGRNVGAQAAATLFLVCEIRVAM